MTIEYSENGNIGYCTIEEADDLSEFEFEYGDEMRRWAVWGNEPMNDNRWVVTGRSWKYRVPWVRDRDDIPTTEHHRRYHLTERDSLAEVEVTEAELKRGDWKHFEVSGDE
jgi:hypothetical protein